MQTFVALGHVISIIVTAIVVIVPCSVYPGREWWRVMRMIMMMIMVVGIVVMGTGIVVESGVEEAGVTNGLVG